MKYLSLILLFVSYLAPALHAETKVCFSPNGGCQEAVIKEINDAKKSINIAMFEFTSRDVAHALVAAKERKVDVKLVLDTREIQNHLSRSRYLIHKDFDIKFHMGPGLMHDKFAVIDDKKVLTGSYNWTVSANKKNDENLIIITDADVAAKFAKEFKHLWSQSGEAHLKETESAEKD